MKNALLTVAGLVIVVLVFMLLTADRAGQVATPTPTVASNPNISATAPLPNSVVTSPLTVTGQAKGTWYFEASFPVKLYDGNNNQIAVAPAQALSDWMTTNFVPFSVTLTFATPATQYGTLVLEKDNPSGLPANDDSISIPVLFW